MWLSLRVSGKALQTTWQLSEVWEWIRWLLRKGPGQGSGAKEFRGSRAAEPMLRGAEGAHIEKEEVKEASIVQAKEWGWGAKSGGWGAARGEVHGGRGQFTPALPALKSRKTFLPTDNGKLPMVMKQKSASVTTRATANLLSFDFQI